MVNTNDPKPFMFKYQNNLLCNQTTGDIIAVTGKLDTILSTLIDYYPNTVPHDVLYNRYDPEVDTFVEKCVTVYIHKLRVIFKKLGAPGAISCDHSIGYRLTQQITVTRASLIISGDLLDSLKNLLLTHPDQTNASRVVMSLFGVV